MHSAFRFLRSPFKALPGAFALSLALSAAAYADPVTVKSFRPPVEVQRAVAPGKWYPARVGLALSAGDLLRTGARGQVELRMTDGSKMVLSAGSQMKIQESSKNRVFGLDFGRVRSYIKRLKGDAKFEVKTPLAAASVRGTVFEVGYDPESRQGYLDVLEGTVALMKDGREVLVPRGERLDYVPDRPLGEAASRRAPDGSTDDARAAVRREVGLGMSKEAVMAAAAEEMRLAEYQEGKTLVDAFGKRVRLEEYIIRRPQEVAAADRDKAFKLVVMNERDDRFDYFYYRGIFNSALPEDLSVAFRDINGKLGSVAPTYYLSSYEMGQSNTQDSVKDTASGGHLVKVTYDGTNFTLSDPANPSANTRTVAEDETSVVDGKTYHKIYDPVNDRFVNISESEFLAGDFRPAVYDPSNDTFRQLGSGDTYWRGRYNSYSHFLNGSVKQSYAVKSGVTNTLAVDLDADFAYAGGTFRAFTETPSGADQLHNRVTLFYGDGTKETVDTYIISDEGKIAPLASFANLTAGAAFKSELLKWNYEQVTTATEFQGRKIDLVVEPKILIKSGLIK